MADSTTCVYNYNRDSRGEKNEEHDHRNQMIDLPKLLRQLSLARVVLKRLPISTEATKLRITDKLAPIDVGIVDHDRDVNVPQDEHVPPSEYIDDDEESHAVSVTIKDTCDIVDDAEQKFADESTAACNRKKTADLIKRNCPKCKTLIADAGVYKKQSCAKCETSLTYQCARCDKQYNSYDSLISHLNLTCTAQNRDFKCPKCDYQTHLKRSMNKHKNYCLSITIYSCSHCEFKARDRSNLYLHMQIKHEDESTATCNRKKPADLIKRNCPKCNTLVAVAKTKSKQLCSQCDNPLSYQCARCDKQYSQYGSCIAHLNEKCNAKNLDLKCPLCNCRTHAIHLFNKHLSHCLRGNHFSCDLCRYTTRLRANLLRHMKTTHKDILKVDCFQCKTKPNKCEQCKKEVPICKICHKAFSSTDSFEEHQKSCKPPVLECKFCSYQTIDNIQLRNHLRLEHLSGSKPGALPVKDEKSSRYLAAHIGETLVLPL